MRINDYSMNEPFKADKRKNEFIRFGKRDDFMKYYVILYFFFNSNMNLKMNFFGYRFELFCRELIFSISTSNSHYNAKLSFFFWDPKLLFFIQINYEQIIAHMNIYLMA